MEKIIVYTKRFELSFNQEGVAEIDVTELVESLAKEYELVDRNPIISIQGNYQYVSFKLIVPSKEKKKVGFSFGSTTV